MLSEEDKYPFVVRARDLKLEHQAQNPGYKYIPKRRSERSSPVPSSVHGLCSEEEPSEQNHELFVQSQKPQQAFSQAPLNLLEKEMSAMVSLLILLLLVIIALFY
jgi:hypothetical protein